jgi:hypothetical protein
MKLYMFRTFRLSIIRSLLTVHSTMVYVIQVCRQLSSRSICSCSWWWTDEMFETCRVSWQNKFVKLVHLVGFCYKEICYDARSHERKMHIYILHTYRTYTNVHIYVPTFRRCIHIGLYIITHMVMISVGVPHKAHHRTGHEGQKGEYRYNYTLSLTSTPDVGVR